MLVSQLLLHNFTMLPLSVNRLKSVASHVPHMPLNNFTQHRSSYLQSAPQWTLQNQKLSQTLNIEHVSGRWLQWLEVHVCCTRKRDSSWGLRVIHSRKVKVFEKVETTVSCRLIIRFWGGISTSLCSSLWMVFFSYASSSTLYPRQ